MRFFLTVFLVVFSSLANAALIPEEYISPLLNNYTEEEKTLIEADLRFIRELVFRNKVVVKDRAPRYLATAGAPLSRKSTILEKVLSEEESFENTVYLDPDQRTLKLMANTYIAKSLSNLEIYKLNDIHQVRRKAYEHWRDASNYITKRLLNEAFESRYDIAHGTTLTGKFVQKFLETLKSNGYEITILVAHASEDFRKGALKYRNEQQGFYQSSPEDFARKEGLFRKNVFFYKKNADHIRFYNSETMWEKIVPIKEPTDLTCFDNAFDSAVGNEPE